MMFRISGFVFRYITVVLLPIVCLPALAMADSYYLTFTEVGNTVTISSDLPVDNLNGMTISIATGANFPGDSFYQSPGSQGGENAINTLPGALGIGHTVATGNANYIGQLNWREPDDPTEYNNLEIDSGEGILFFIGSDNAYASFGPAPCYSNSIPVACPILNAGETFSDDFTYTYPVTGDWLNGTINITFNDLGDTAPVPEPGTFMMLGTGLLGFGGALKRKFLL
jgi:hypothetical protein